MPSGQEQATVKPMVESRVVSINENESGLYRPNALISS